MSTVTVNPARRKHRLMKSAAISITAVMISIIAIYSRVQANEFPTRWRWGKRYLLTDAKGGRVMATVILNQSLKAEKETLLSQEESKVLEKT